jgi:hypothetical protein
MIRMQLFRLKNLKNAVNWQMSLAGSCQFEFYTQGPQQELVQFYPPTYCNGKSDKVCCHQLDLPKTS